MAAISVSYIKLLKKIKDFCDLHYQIKRYGFDFEEQIGDFEATDNLFPFIYVVPVSKVVGENINTFTIRIYCADQIMQSRNNVNTIVSDADLILNDIYRYFKDGSDVDVDVLSDPTITPINNAFLDKCAGCVMDLQVEVASYGLCEIPLETQTPQDACEVLLNQLTTDQLNECILPTYDFSDTSVLDNLTEQQELDLEAAFCEGGGCGEIEVYVRDEDGQEVSYFIDPDVSTIITLNDVTATVKNSANTTIGSGLVSPIIGGTVTVNDITFTDTDNTTSSKAAGINFSATLIPALSAAQLNDVDDGLTFTQKDNLTALLDIKTGQTISYRTGDDGDIEQGSLLSFVVLAAQNPYGNSNRFTDTSGGQTYSDGIIVDWSRRLMWYNPAATANWNNSIDAALSSNQGGFTDWHIPNVQQAQSIMNYGNSGGMLNYTPFNISFASMWTSTTSPDTTTSAFRVLVTGATTAGGIAQVGKTTTNNYMYCRIFSLSDLGL
jgi:hypothetical protein